MKQKRKKHVHEIRVDDLLMRESTSDDISSLADMLLKRESLYLDPKTIRREQIIKLLDKLYS